MTTQRQSSAQRVLVTGSAGGIGRSIAGAFLEAGHDVVRTDISSSAPEGTRICDLSSWSACLELAHSVGRIDILVNNAAVLVDTPLEELSEQEFEQTVAVNLRAPFLLTRELAPAMCARGFGRVINVASIGARTGGLFNSGVYSATKAGLVSLTKHFARTCAPHGVTVNAVAPGGIDAPMAHRPGAAGSEQPMDVPHLVPAGRWGRVEEVASVVAYLASAGASFVTGATVDVNGGWMMA